jgi:hypothetical protein
MLTQFGGWQTAFGASLIITDSVAHRKRRSSRRPLAWRLFKAGPLSRDSADSRLHCAQPDFGSPDAAPALLFAMRLRTSMGATQHEPMASYSSPQGLRSGQQPSRIRDLSTTPSWKIFTGHAADGSSQSGPPFKGEPAAPSAQREAGRMKESPRTAASLMGSTGGLRRSRCHAFSPYFRVLPLSDF